jgi:hypothetical protein
MCRLIAAHNFLRTPENNFKQFLQLVLGRPFSYPQSMAQNRHFHTEKGTQLWYVIDWFGAVLMPPFYCFEEVHG